MSVGLEAVAAVHSFLHGCALRHPEHAALVQRVLAIPPKRAEKRTITFLNLTRADAHLGTRSPRARPRQRTQGARRPAHAPDRRGAARLDPRDRGRARGLAVSFSSPRAAYPRRVMLAFREGLWLSRAAAPHWERARRQKRAIRSATTLPTARRRNAGVAPVVPSAHSETVGGRLGEPVRPPMQSLRLGVPMGDVLLRHVRRPAPRLARAGRVSPSRCRRLDGQGSCLITVALNGTASSSISGA